MKVYLPTNEVLSDEEAYIKYRKLSDGKAEPIESIIWSDWDIYPFIYPEIPINHRMTNTLIEIESGYTYAVEMLSAEELMLQTREQIIQAVQSKLDRTAQSRNYDNILSLCSYANSTDQIFASEGQAGVAWRDACWRTCYEIVTAVQNGERSLPTVSEVLAELPKINW